MSNEKCYTAKNQNYEYWHTTTGSWFPGERIVLHGVDVLATMTGKTWMEVILLAITGKIPERRTAEFLDAVLALSGSIPDPRLWNNRIAALAGVTRSTPALGMSAGMAASDAIIFGFQPMMGAHNLLTEIAGQLDGGDCLENIINERLTRDLPGRPGAGKQRTLAIFPGYGRPVATGDERIPAILKLLRDYGHDQDKMVALAFRLETSLQQHGLPLRLNTGGLIAAICADQGMSALQLYYYVSHCFYVSLVACNADALRHDIGSFFPLRCNQIEYEGVEERKWGSE
jgi:hypothetical protein